MKSPCDIGGVYQGAVPAAPTDIASVWIDQVKIIDGENAGSLVPGEGTSLRLIQMTLDDLLVCRVHFPAVDYSQVHQPHASDACTSTQLVRRHGATDSDFLPASAREPLAFDLTVSNDLGCGDETLVMRARDQANGEDVGLSAREQIVPAIWDYSDGIASARFDVDNDGVADDIELSDVLLNRGGEGHTFHWRSAGGEFVSPILSTTDTHRAVLKDVASEEWTGFQYTPLHWRGRTVLYIRM